MTFANYTRATETGLGLEISAALHHLMQRFSDYRIYRATLNELQNLDDRSLADLGLHRSGLRSAALEAVYGIQN
ncbi:MULTISPECIES: DUF1127 domain-containing protein [Roseovarius]|uniref:DUF1127 domain-containing protein n=1 Tax=Roseovarius TaxID=74030 RepID=UPI001C0A9653|nr:MULTISPECIES: DUF1127 domain-containing protein [Roseovarius]MBU3259354.1 DUF1127 domain-containing protein [Roseovarius sp. PS-C2]MDW3117138.1 DUF1127 domain-containing protein [Roseovarius pacificus]